MKSLMVLIACLCAPWFLTSCSVPRYQAQTSVRFAFPSVDVAGACASQMSVDDVRQIRNLAHSRPDILKPIDQIVTDRPDEAEVKTGNPEKSGDPMTTFEVRKKKGQWIIIGKPYTSSETIITG
jgi:hypothetical protein